jgi:subtilisin family serine protease
MKHPAWFSLYVSAALFSILPAVAMVPTVSAASDSAGEVQIIVKPKSTASDVPLKAMLAAHGAQQSNKIDALSAKVVRVSSAQASQLLSGLKGSSDTEYAEIDGTAQALGTANDPLFSSEWHLTKIQAPAAWDYTTGTSSVIVAVVDTGVYFTHPDLKGKLLSTGYDFVDNDSDPTDENGHGTAVAGTIAPDANNSIGVAGVAWANPILPVRVLDANGSGSYSNIANGIIYAADQGAKIINLSLGGTSSSVTLQNAINYAWNKQCVIVAAAGNNGNNVTVYPAACTNVVSVAATNSSDVHTSWSSYGSFVDICAPGDGIVTLEGTDSYASWSGTSFSSPITAGVLALMASVNTTLSNTQLVTLLLNNSDDLGTTGTDVYYGAGRVNALRAVTAAKNYSTSDTTAPVVTFVSPANNSTLSGTASVSVKATDNIGVTKVELYLDSQLISTSATASAVFSLNTASYTSGTHTLKASGYDAAGNVGSASIAVTLKNSTSSSTDTTAPTVAITSPANGSKINPRMQNVSVTSADNIGVTKLEVYLDGTLACTATASRIPASVGFSWDTSRLSAGNHKLQVYAYDAAKNVGQSAVVTVSK